MVPSAVELRHLRYFVAVAEEGGFGRASRRLRVAQPALSRQIRQLEDEIGRPLLVRRPDGTELTPAGEMFLRDATSILDRSQNAIQSARSGGVASPPPLALGYVWGLFHSLAPAHIAAFRLVRPDVPVHLFDLTALQQAEALREGRIDAGFIGFAHEAEAAGLALRPVGMCALCAALPASHAAARRRRLPLASLAAESFVMISDLTYPGAARWITEACAAAGFRPRILQAAERGHTLLSLVAAGCGIALVPEPLQQLPHPGVVFRPLAEPTPLPLHLAWNPARPHPTRDVFLHTPPPRPSSPSRPASRSPPPNPHSRPLLATPYPASPQ